MENSEKIVLIIKTKKIGNKKDSTLSSLKSPSSNRQSPMFTI